ncbi:MAG: CDGSH iron-sulfur domain-containing protein [Silicimonas sp.]|nr:CDGSH iron-sulfur domain-containing protein [Silicimonas sp.]
MKPVETDELVIHFDARACVHARRCVLGLPGVFDPDKQPWIQPGGTDTEAITDVIEACPSGALRYERKNGAQETAPPANTVRLWENGPLEVRGDLRIEGHAPRHRALICRCGLTSNPPFCDNSHRDHFTATSVPKLKEDKDVELESHGGPLEISARPNSPVMMTGNVEVTGSDGSRVARTEKSWFCRCGASGNKPFCNGSHGKIGFQKEGTGEG